MYDHKPVQKRTTEADAAPPTKSGGRRSGNLDPGSQPGYAEQVQMMSPVQKKEDGAEPSDVSLEREKLNAIGSQGYEGTIMYTGALTERQTLMRNLAGKSPRETQTQYVEIRFRKGESAAASGQKAAEEFISEGGPAASAPFVAKLVEDAIKDGRASGRGGE
ncbi:MAG: hypothetical protein ACI9MR_005212 [Myxococcota bacterium]|jgi:hypothetical protein